MQLYLDLIVKKLLFVFGVWQVYRSTFVVPAVIVAYNQYMNGVDRVDQRVSTNATSRKEPRLHMSVLTYFMDLATNNAFSIFQEVDCNEEDRKGKYGTYFDFKRRLCAGLIAPYLKEKDDKNRRKRKKLSTPSEDSNDDGERRVDYMLGSNGHHHMLVENVNRKETTCYMCSMRGIHKKSIYGCTGCRKGFHVNCFTAYHCQGVLIGKTRQLCQVVLQAKKQSKYMNRCSKYIGNISDMILPEKK